jgi:hypothetical protein
MVTAVEESWTTWAAWLAVIIIIIILIKRSGRCDKTLHHHHHHHGSNVANGVGSNRRSSLVGTTTPTGSRPRAHSRTPTTSGSGVSPLQFHEPGWWARTCCCRKRHVLPFSHAD